jgi:predicted DNA binding protein
VPRARLTVTLPEGVWVGRLSRANPETTFRVLSAFTTGEGGVGVLEVERDGDPRVVVEAIEGQADVTEVTVLHAETGRALVQFGTTQPQLLQAVQAAGAPVDLPVRIVDGAAELTVTATHDRLAALGERLDAFGLAYRLESLDGDLEREDPLTDGQRDLLATALAAGYYDTPREATLTEVAERVGRAKSTVSETLHRAESALVRSYFD